MYSIYEQSFELIIRPFLADDADSVANEDADAVVAGPDN